jgi:hypothetical protein
MRNPKLQIFIESTFDLLEGTPMPTEGRDLARQAKSNLARVVEKSAGGVKDNPVRDSWLASAIEVARDRNARVGTFYNAFGALEPDLAWRRRGDAAPDDSPKGYANALIVGPNGHEDRDDVWLGMTLMSPTAQYPIHRHPPRELYLALTEGEWLRGEEPWFSPGVLGTVYNPPGVVHSMRSVGTPFLALWLLVA